MVDDVTKTLKINGTTQDSIPAWLNYTVTYSDGVGIDKNHILEHGTNEVYKVRIEFIRDITNAQFNEAKGKTLTFEYDVEYKQKGEGAVPVDHSEYVYTAFDITNPEYTGNEYITLNQTLPSFVIRLNSYDETINTFTMLYGGLSVFKYEDFNYCSNHKLVNNKVVESYIVFKIYDSMKQRYSGINSGIFTLRGGVDESQLSNDDKIVYKSNKSILHEAFGNNCEEDDDVYGCGWNNDIGASIDSSGSVLLYDGRFTCVINSDGTTSC